MIQPSKVQTLFSFCRGSFCCPETWPVGPVSWLPSSSAACARSSDGSDPRETGTVRCRMKTGQSGCRRGGWPRSMSGGWQERTRRGGPWTRRHPVTRCCCSDPRGSRPSARSWCFSGSEGRSQWMRKRGGDGWTAPGRGKRWVMS